MKVDFFENFFNKKLNLNIENFSEVSTDSRTIKKDALFIPLSGENFDGNKFVLSALEKGAAVAITSDPDLKKENIIFVPDTLKAFQELSQAWQKHVNPKIIGITGSNGKTTSKFFTAQILNNFFNVCYSPKSFNNEIGVPITQSLLKESDEILISEIGTNHPGEIKSLTQMINPQICVVTTVGPSHLEGFGTIENVAKEKNEIYNSKDAQVRIFNLDNEWTKKMFDQYKGEKITFSTLSPEADIYLKPEQVSLSKLIVTGSFFGKSIKKELNLFGEHNVYNIMVALACGKALGVDEENLISNLKSFQTPWGRSQIYKNSFGGEVLFDAYNSNLQSMSALFDSLKKIKNQKINLILGEMLELGEESPSYHQKLGEKALELDLESLIFIGPSYRHFSEPVMKARFDKKSIFSDTYNEELAIKVKSMVDPKGLTVIKGSRGMKLERFFESLGVSES